MTIQLTIENELESYETLKALIERKEKSTDAKETIQGLIDQFKGTNSYTVLIEDN